MKPYSITELAKKKSSYTAEELSKKKENYDIGNMKKEYDRRLDELQAKIMAYEAVIAEMEIKSKNVLPPEVTRNLMNMQTVQRSLNIPVPIDQGGTGVTTLAAAQALLGGGGTAYDQSLNTTDDVTFNSATLTTPLAIADGGTASTSAQTAINALTQVSGATNEHVLTKDTATGHAIFKAASGGSLTDSGTTVYLTDTTDEFVVGGSSPISSSKVSIDGDADQIQMTIQGHSTQTSNVFVVEKSDGTDLLAVSNTAGITVGGTSSGIGSSVANTALTMTTAWCDKVVTLTDGATPALDASLGNIFVLVAAGDRTIAVPSNATSGQKIIIRHNASGGARTLALNSGAGGFRFGTDITALTATSSGKTDYIGCVYNSTDSKWDVVAYTKGY